MQLAGNDERHLQVDNCMTVVVQTMHRRYRRCDRSKCSGTKTIQTARLCYRRRLGQADCVRHNQARLNTPARSCDTDESWVIAEIWPHTGCSNPRLLSACVRLLEKEVSTSTQRWEADFRFGIARARTGNWRRWARLQMSPQLHICLCFCRVRRCSRHCRQLAAGAHRLHSAMECALGQEWLSVCRTLSLAHPQ